MNDMIASLTKKVGISPEQAKASIQHILSELKSKLPAPLAGHIDGLMGTAEPGEAPAEGGGLMGKLSSMLGK